MPTTIRVWTHHPSTFPITSPNLVVDATRSVYYRSQEYRDAIHELHHHLKGETQFLWCLTARKTFERHSESIDLIEWELDVPASQILTFYREDVWEPIYHGRSHHWADLLTDLPAENVGALVRVPIDPSWATPHAIPVKYRSQ
ncbi:MAG: hypothetical protein AB8B91_26025 [Rubripirellula sp.]